MSEARLISSIPGTTRLQPRRASPASVDESNSRSGTTPRLTPDSRETTPTNCKLYLRGEAAETREVRVLFPLRGKCLMIYEYSFLVWMLWYHVTRSSCYPRHRDTIWRPGYATFWCYYYQFSTMLMCVSLQVHISAGVAGGRVVRWQCGRRRHVHENAPFGTNLALGRSLTGTVVRN